MVGVPMPSRRFLVTSRSRYRPSSGVAQASSPASSSSLRPCEPVPSAAAISLSVRTTSVTSRLAAWPPRPRPGQQPLGGLTKVTGLSHEGGDLHRVRVGRGGHRADGELLGQAKVHPGELGRDQPLAQVTHGRQQLRRSLRQQRRQPVRQRQPAAELLQVTVGLGHDQVPHGRPPSRLIMTRLGCVTLDHSGRFAYPDRGSYQTRILRPVSGSMKTSSVGCAALPLALLRLPR